MTFLSNLNWRYATKAFDPEKKVSDADLDTLLEAIRLTPTSFGLQPYHFFVVTNPEIKTKIQAAAWNQPQITTCSHLIVFAIRTDFRQIKEEYFTLMSGGTSEGRAQLKGFEDMMDGFLVSKSQEWLENWAARQLYIAHGFGLAACAELQIDSCAMEGGDFGQIGEILGLPETQKALVMLPIGYRPAHVEPRPKVRFRKEDLFTEIR